MIATYAADITVSVEAKNEEEAKYLARIMEQEASSGEFSHPNLFATDEAIWEKALPLLSLDSIDVAGIEEAKES